MATLATDLAAKFRQTLKDQGLTFRNWSGSDGWVFAVYTKSQDGFIGTVQLIEESRTLRICESRTTRLTKAELKMLGDLCAAFNRL